MTQSQEPRTGVNDPDQPVKEPVASPPGDGQNGGEENPGKAKKPPVAQKPKLTASSVQGNVTTTWLSYRALSDVAKAIANDLKAYLGGSIVISAADSTLDDLRQWRLFESALSGAQNYCDSVLARCGYPPATQPEAAETTVQAGLEAWTAALTSVSGIFALFKTTITTTQHQFELDETGIISAVAAQILVIEKDTVIKSPRSLATRSNLSTDSGKAIAKLMATRTIATELAAANKNDAIKTAELDAVVKLVDGIIDQVQYFGGGEIARSILNGETIHKALSDENTLLLDLKPIIGGGDQINIKRNFFHTEEFYVNGVAAVSFSLVNAEGMILATGNVHKHTGYFRHDAVENGVWGNSLETS